MAGTSKGQLLERKWRSGVTYAVRVHAYGRRHYLTLGSDGDGWTRSQAEAELQNILPARTAGDLAPAAIRTRAGGEDRRDGALRKRDLSRVRLALARGPTE